MDPAGAIAELRVKRDAFEQQLLVPSIDKDKEIVIRKIIGTIGAEITAWLPLLAKSASARVARQTVAIKVSLTMHHPYEKRLPFVFEAFADCGSSFALLCSPATWAHVTEHLPETIMDCDQWVAVATGMRRMTKLATVLIELTLSDGSKANGIMHAYPSDKDLLGLMGLEYLGLYVDAPRKCLSRAKMLFGSHHFCVSPTCDIPGGQVRHEGPPRFHEGAAHAADTALSQCHFQPTILGGAICRRCGKRRHEHQS